MKNYAKVEELIKEAMEVNSRKIGNKHLAMSLEADLNNAYGNKVYDLLSSQYHTWRVANKELRDTFEKKQIIELLTEIKLQIR